MSTCHTNVVVPVQVTLSENCLHLFPLWLFSLQYFWSNFFLPLTTYCWKYRLIIVKNVLSDCFWNAAGKCWSSFCGFLHYTFFSIFTHWKSEYCSWQGRIIIWVHNFATNTTCLKLFEAWKQNWHKCMAGVLILIIICGNRVWLLYLPSTTIKLSGVK